MNKKTNPMQESEFAFVVETPMQMFNALRFVLGNEMNSRGHADLYMGGNFVNMQTIFFNVQRTGIFNNIYLLQNLEWNLWHKVQKAYSMIFPKRALMKLGLPELNFQTEYKYLCVSSLHMVIFWYLSALKYHETICFEDGVHANVGDIHDSITSKKIHLFDKCFCRGKIFKPFTRLYLSNPGFHSGTIDAQLCQLPEIRPSSAEFKTISNVFGYKENDLYARHRLIYLAQPLADDRHISGEVYTEYEDDVLDLMPHYASESLIIRHHPRQSGEKYEDFTVDRLNNMWELECVSQITEEHILLAVSSTAQVSPKLLFDKEPYVVFTYKLLSQDLTTDFRKRAEAVANNLKEIYRCKNKIFVPDTFDDLEQILKSLTIF